MTCDAHILAYEAHLQRSVHALYPESDDAHVQTALQAAFAFGRASRNEERLALQNKITGGWGKTEPVNNLHLNGGGLEQLKRDAFALTLRKCGGNMVQTAKMLKVSRGTAYEWRKEMALALCLLLSLCAQGQTLFSFPQPLAAVAPVVNPSLGSLSFAWTRSPSSNVVSYSVQYGTNRPATHRARTER